MYESCQVHHHRRNIMPGFLTATAHTHSAHVRSMALLNSYGGVAETSRVKVLRCGGAAACTKHR